MKIQLVKGENIVISESKHLISLFTQNGTIWLTQTGNAEDVVLDEGKVFIVRKGKVILEALSETASLEIQVRSPQQPSVTRLSY